MDKIQELSQTFNNDNLKSTSFEDIEMEHIQWFWNKRIALGKITMIAGEPGLGKSQITAYLCSQASKGLPWPGTHIPAPQGHALLLSAEDDPSDTIKPRLMAIGADLRYCHYVDPIMGDDKSFSLDKDIDHLETLIQKISNVRLVIIDPLSAYYGKTDSHRDSEVRAVLSKLGVMAAENNFAVVLIAHLNKSEGLSPLNRVIGSIGAPAASRAVFTVIKDQEQPERRYFLPIKNNIGNDKYGFAYHIEGVTLDNGIETSKICFESGLIDAHKILNPTEQKPTAINAAGEFLLDLLIDGAVPKARIEEEADGAGYSKSALQRAKKRLGIKHRKKSFNEGWEWYLPEGSEDAEDI